MNREQNIHHLRKNQTWDVIVIGGGASGLGVALDACSRGLKVLLVDKTDFAKGTSSRSTKLLHGGVRYLAQGNVALVLEALKERGIIMKNAPHVSHRQSFVIPIYTFFDQIKYLIGLKLYDLMAGSLRIGKSTWLSKTQTLAHLPTINSEGLRGGVIYYDGQFDDARLAINLAQTCESLGGTMLNYMKVTGLLKDDQGQVIGVKLKDQLTKLTYKVKGQSVVNATGVFADKILQMDNPKAATSIMPSQGIHLVLDLRFLGGEHALMIPKTSDGRVLFGIPWQGKLVLGTTDTVRKVPKLEPKALEKEIDFILNTAREYLTQKPTRADVLAVYAGLRPLAAPKEGSSKTKEISRSHKVVISKSGLVSIIGGKWTTFRKMGEDTVGALIKLKKISSKPSTSATIKIHGFPEQQLLDKHLANYGQDALEIQELIKNEPVLAEKLHPDYPYTAAEVIWMVREEMARHIEDVLARRMRILFIDAKAATEMSMRVAELMQEALDQSDTWKAKELEAFQQLAAKYLIP